MDWSAISASAKDRVTIEEENPALGSKIVEELPWL